MDIYNILKKLDAVEKKTLTESVSTSKLTEGQMKRWLEDKALSLSKADFIANADEYGMSPEEAAEFWINTTGGDNEEELAEGSMKDWLWKQAERLEKADFIANADEYGMRPEEAAEFWTAINGDDDELDEAWPGTPEYELRFGKPDVSSAFDKKRVSTGTVYSRKYQDEPEAADDTPRKAGRPTGTGRKLGAKGPSVGSKLLKGKGGLKEGEAAFKPGDRVMYMNTFATIVTCDGETCGIKVDKHPGTMMVPTSQVKKPSYDEGMTEARPDVMRHTGDKTVRIVKKGGKPIGEIGIDAGPGGNGDYYVKLYDGSFDAAGYETAEEALEELKYAVKQMSEGSYSAKAARAGKDIGKPGKNFAKIAKGAAERYGSKAAGERVAGAVLNKLRHPSEGVEESTVTEAFTKDDYKKIAKLKAWLMNKHPHLEPEDAEERACRRLGYDYDEVLDWVHSDQLDEKAPPGAKAERMVKHIKKSLSKDGHLSDKDKAIAYATTWKAHNQGKVEEEGAQPNPKEDQWTAQALAQHKRKLAQDANRRKMAPKPMEEDGMGGTVAGGVAPAPGAKTFAEASSESHTAEWKAAGKAVHAILKKCGYKGTKTEKGYMWTKQTPKGTAFVDIDFDERDPEVVAWGEGELKGAKDKSYWQSGSGNINEIAGKIAELFANVKPGEAPKEMDEADADGKHKPDADKDGVPDWADKKPGKDDNEESEDKDDSKESDDDGDDALKKMKKHAGVDKKEDDDDKEESDDKDDDKEESDDKDDKEESDSKDNDEDKEEKSESKDKSGTPYGQSVYESAFKKQLKQQLNESISMNTSQDDNGNKSVTVTATDEDADKLGEMLKMAGLFSSGGYEKVETGADHVDEDLANAPDETYSDMDTILNKLSGGLNGPKTTGQTTAPVINRDVKRQGPSVKTTVTDIKEETESKLWNLYKKYDNK